MTGYCRRQVILMETEYRFYEVLLVNGDGWPQNVFLVQATSHANATVEALKHIPEGLYIRKVWEEGQMDSGWVSVLNKLGHAPDSW